MIPVSQPWLSESEFESVDACVRSGWISSVGDYLTQFETDWAAYCGRRHGIAVSNGTVALELACTALDLKPGDEVIMPSFTIISCALAVIRAGGIPVLVDADPETWCMDVDQVESRITPNTRAIMPVHIYGHPVDMDPIMALAHRHHLAVVEDAAEAHGAEYRSERGEESVWRRCGSFGAMSCFSFYANKIVTTGEGGMVLTDDDALADRLRGLRNLCFGRSRRFEHEGMGFNYRLSNVHAAIGVAQVARIEQCLDRKRWLAAAYGKALEGVPGLRLPVARPWARNVYWMYGIVLDEAAGMDAAAFSSALEKRGVESRPFFLGMHEQPALRERGLFDGERYPVSERLARQGIYLPSFPTLTEAQVEAVAAAIGEILA